MMEGLLLFLNIHLVLINKLNSLQPKTYIKVQKRYHFFEIQTLFICPHHRFSFIYIYFIFFEKERLYQKLIFQLFNAFIFSELLFLNIVLYFILR